MGFYEYIFEKINQYFNVKDLSTEECINIKPFKTFDPFPYLHNNKTVEEYIIYDMPSSFHINILDHSNGVTTSVTFDSKFEIYYREKKKEEPHIDFSYKQNFYQLSYVVNGELNALIEGKSYILPRRSIVITNRNVIHREERVSDFTVIHFCFKPAFLQDVSKYFNESNSVGSLLKETEEQPNLISYLMYLPKHENIESIEGIAKDLFDEMVQKRAKYIEICKFLLLRMFIEIQNSNMYQFNINQFFPSSERTLYDETLKYIIDAKRKVTRQELGEYLNYNGNYISNVFRKHAGISLAKYVRDICVSHAAHLLLNTDMQIKDIMHELGYENKTAFYKNFSEKYGMNPGEYRINTKKEHDI